MIPPQLEARRLNAVRILSLVGIWLAWLASPGADAASAAVQAHRFGTGPALREALGSPLRWAPASSVQLIADTPAQTEAPTPAISNTPTPTASPTVSLTPLPTATETLTPTITPTPGAGIPSLDPIGWEGEVIGLFSFQWSGMSGIQTWITPGDGMNWQGTRAHTLFATTNVPTTGSVIEVCYRGGLPFAEWDGGGLRQLPTTRPAAIFPGEVRFVHRSWMCARNELDLSRTNGAMSIGHRFGSEGRRQPGISPPDEPAIFTWQVWVKSLNGYEFAEPAWPFGDLLPISEADPKPGLGGGSGPGDPRECHVSTCADSQGHAGDPINTRTGSFDFSLVDLSMPSAAGPLLFQRTYSSAAVDLYDEPLGFGWTHNQDTRLIFEDDPGGEPGLVWFKAHSASRYGFVQYDTGTFGPLPGVLAELTRDPGPPVTLTLVDTSQAVYTFDEAGRLLSWSDAENNEFLYAYDGSGRLEQVSEGARHFSLAYDTDGRLSSVTDHAGRTVLYGYDATGDMVSATDVLGQVWSYSYDSSHHLTQLTDPRGVVALRLEYDSEGRAVRQFDGLGNRIAEISYNADGTSTITDARGNVEVHFYDERGLLVSTMDALGGTTRRGYDPNLRANSTTDPAGHTTTLEWSDDGENLLRVFDAQSNQTSLAYDDSNNLLSVTDPRGHTTSYAYDGRLLSSSTDALGNTTNFTYTSQGFPTSVTDPLGRTVTFTSNAFGERTSMTDPLGNTWAFAYDNLGRLVQVTDPLDRAHLNEYDAAGRLIRVTLNYEPSRPQNDLNEFNIVTIYEYDPVGNLQAVTDTLGRITRFEYDAANRLIQVTDPGGNASQFTYDPAGNLTGLADPLGRTTTFGYDALNRAVSSTNPLGQVRITAYNPDGTIASTRDPLGRVTNYNYDELKRLLSVRHAMGGITAYGYDAAGNLLSVTDPNRHRTSTVWDALSRPVAVTDPNGHRRTAAYDAVGNLVSLTDPLGNATTYGYDARNLLLMIADPLGHVTSYAYDPIGRQTGVTDANGVLTRYEFDGLDRLAAVVQNAQTGVQPDDHTNVVTAYSYDPVGNLLTIRDARGNSRGFTYDLLDRLLTETDPLGHQTGYTYDTVGNLVGRTDAMGFTTALSYDPADQLTLVDYPAPDADVSFTYDAAGNRTGMTDGVGSSSWLYDALDRATSVTDPFGAVVGYGYDSAGNRTSLTHPDGKTVTYAYDPADRLIEITDWASTDTIYSYDSADRLAAVLLPNGVASSLEYDAAGRLTALTHSLAAEELASYVYRYDGVGNRVRAIESLLYPWQPTAPLALAASGLAGRANAPAIGSTVSGPLPIDPLAAMLGPVALLLLVPLRQFRRNEKVATVLLILVGLSGFSLAIAACSPPTPTPTPTSTWTPGPVSTATPTETPTWTPIPTDTATATITATSTDTATPAPTPTPEPVVLTTTIDYAYDPLYRLIAADYSDGSFFHYTYDSAGNRLTQDTQAGMNIYGYDAADRLTSVDGVAYSWDENGNLLSDGVRNFGYDHANRLSSVLDGANRYNFSYNGLGDRLQQQVDGLTTRFTLDLESGLTQVLSDGTSSYLVQPSVSGLPRIGEQGPAGWSYSLTDALGSIRQLTDAAGQVRLAQTFEPFGAVFTAAGFGSSAFGFTGEQTDPTGLVYLRARLYDPATGRFLTKDPFPGFAALPATLHPYEYVLNNPVNLVDPSGRIAPILAAVGLGALIGGGAGALGYALSHPGGSLGDYLGSGCFWRSVGIGAAAGAIAGLTAFGVVTFLPTLGLAGSSFGATVATGFIASGAAGGAFEAARQFLTTGRFYDPVGILVTAGISAVAGAAFAGLSFGIRQGVQALATWRMQGLTSAANRAPVPQTAIRGGAGPVRQGALGVERTIADLEASGGRVLGHEITIEAGGVTTRPDLFVELPNAQQVFLEVKTGASAALTPNQRAAFPFIRSQGGIVRGANAAAAGLTPGTAVGPIPVWVVHQPWPPW